MDINLTGQIWGMPFNIFGQTNEKLWWISLVVVLVGGAITYFVTITIEDSKRHADLRKQAYFEFIDQIASARRLIIEYRRLEALDATTNPTRNTDLRTQYRLIQDFYPQFDAAKLKVQACGSNKVKNLIRDWTITAVHTEIHSNEFDTITRQVIDAMRQNLMGKRWWQFWK